MTPLAQRIAIAKAVGAIIHETTCAGQTEYIIHGPKTPFWDQYKVRNPEESLSSHHLPNYLSDLNAIHSAWEQCIAPHDDLRAQWRYWLAFITKRDEHKLPYKRSVSCAPCSIRAEAFLRTLSLWEENPPS